MARPHSKQTEPAITPLLPLEYCTPARAAKLLGCEVEDIFHWAEVGAITLYAEFYRNANGDADELIVGSAILDANIPSEKLKSSSFLPEEVTEYETFVDVLGCEMKISLAPYEPDLGLAADDNIERIIYGPKGFKLHACLDVEQPNKGLINRTVSLSGLWAIEQSNVYQLHFTGQKKTEQKWTLYADYTSGWYYSAHKKTTKRRLNKRPSIYLENVVIEDIAARVRVTRDDLLKIQQHMISGELIRRKKRSQEQEMEAGTEQDQRNDLAHTRGRVTKKQCCFIVNLLKSHGLTDADFRGSITELRKKIASKAICIDDQNLDDKTLIDWLEKGGAR